MRKPWQKFTLLQGTVHVSAWLLAAWLFWQYFANLSGANPIQTATQQTGKYALVFLTLSLACTPLNILLNLRQALSVRRALGLYAFLFALAHFLIFAGLDYGLNFELIVAEITQRRYILVGSIAILILTILAITSFQWWMKYLGKNWKRLHRLVYLAGILIILHSAWASKGNLLRLQGNIEQPLAFGLVILLLLAVRIPFMRRLIAHLRVSQRPPKRFSAAKNPATSPSSPKLLAAPATTSTPGPNRPEKRRKWKKPPG